MNISQIGNITKGGVMDETLDVKKQPSPNFW